LFPAVSNEPHSILSFGVQVRTYSNNVSREPGSVKSGDSRAATALRPVAEKAAPSEPAQGTAPPSTKLDLLMDAELDVTLRFGKRSMLLREVMELEAGSIVALDRQVQEPVDLLLAGRLIGRGEVVVVNGNYGLRVLEVISPPPH
jgi:flagellar motor switch protein FliN